MKHFIEYYLYKYPDSNISEVHKKYDYDPDSNNNRTFQLVDLPMKLFIDVTKPGPHYLLYLEFVDEYAQEPSSPPSPLDVPCLQPFIWGVDMGYGSGLKEKRRERLRSLLDVDDEDAWSAEERKRLDFHPCNTRNWRGSMDHEGFRKLMLKVLRLRNFRDIDMREVAVFGIALRQRMVRLLFPVNNMENGEGIWREVCDEFGDLSRTLRPREELHDVIRLTTNWIDKKDTTAPGVHSTTRNFNFSTKLFPRRAFNTCLFKCLSVLNEATAL
jgi:hypothetical protein